MKNNPSSLIEGVDFYLDENQNMVFKEKFLLQRGYCCESGCSHCPYGFSKKVDSNIPVELQDPWKEEKEKNDELFDDDLIDEKLR